MACIQTPSDLELLIHCHVSPNPHPRASAPAIVDGIARLMRAGLIVQVNRSTHYTTTEKGQFYLEHLLKQPFPESTYYIPEVD